MASTLWSTRNPVQVDGPGARLPAEKVGQHVGINEAKLDQDLRKLPPVALLLPFRQVQLDLRHQPCGEELLRQRHPLLLHRHTIRTTAAR